MSEVQTLKSTIEWMRSRPRSVQALMRRFPLGASVKAREDLHLLAPAPGVVGHVASYDEHGGIGVVAPLAHSIISPITGESASEGEVIRGMCDPEHLELTGEFFAHPEGVELTPAWVDKVLA